jgi:hypothetical protein
VLLDEVVAKAYSAPHPAKKLSLDTPFQEVVRARREVPSPSEGALSDFLQHHKPPTVAQRQAQPQNRPPGHPEGQPRNEPPDQPGQRSDERASFGVRDVISTDLVCNSPKTSAKDSPTTDANNSAMISPQNSPWIGAKKNSPLASSPGSLPVSAWASPKTSAKSSPNFSLLPALRRKSISWRLVDGQTRIKRELTAERLKAPPVGRSDGLCADEALQTPSTTCRWQTTRRPHLARP